MLGMLLTGSANTILMKMQDQTLVVPDGSTETRYFVHPFV